MPQIISPQFTPIVTPPLQSAFVPLRPHDYTVGEFTAPYAFVPRPVDPNAQATLLVNSLNQGEQMGLEQAKWNAGAKQREAANDYSQAGIDAYQKWKAGPLTNVPATSDAPPSSGSMPDASAVGTGGSLTPTTTNPADFGNAGAPNADGFHFGIGTGFAGQGDLNKYNAAKAAGASEQEALKVGDNGVGKWGANTAGDTPYVALTPQLARAYGLDPDKLNGQLVQVQANGQTTTARVGDVLPDHSANGSSIDLNPAALKQLGVDDADNFKGKVAFRLLAGGQPDNAPSILPSAVGTGAALWSGPAPAVPVAGTADTFDVKNDGGALGRAMASVAADDYRNGSALANVTRDVPARAANPLANLVANPNGGVAMLGATTQPIASQALAGMSSVVPPQPPVVFSRDMSPPNPQPLATNPLYARTPTLADVLAQTVGPGATVDASGHVSLQTALPLSPQEAALKQAEINELPQRQTLLNAQTQAAQIGVQKAALGLPGNGPVQATPVVDPASGRVLEYMTPAGSTIPAVAPGSQTLLTDAANHQVDPTPFKNPDGSYNADAIRAAIAQKTAGNTQDLLKQKNAYDTALASLNSMRAYLKTPTAQRTAAGDANFTQAAAHVEVPDRASTHSDMQALQNTGSTMDAIKTGLSGLPGLGPKRNLSDDQITNMFNAAAASVEQRRLLVQQALQGGTASLTTQSVLPSNDPAAVAGSAAVPAVAPVGKSSGPGPVVVTTAAQYASLPSGTLYTDSTGKQARKP